MPLLPVSVCSILDSFELDHDDVAIILRSREPRLHQVNQQHCAPGLARLCHRDCRRGLHLFVFEQHHIADFSIVLDDEPGSIFLCLPRR
jgi:hypothetical protein